MFQKFDIIVKMDSEYGISKDGAIPWRDTSHNDLKLFKSITTAQKSVLIMGRNTYSDFVNNNTIGSERVIRLDSQRTIIVVGGELTFNEALNKAHSLSTDSGALKIFVCGGSRLYNEAIAHPLCGGIYYNIIQIDYKCDNNFTLFPKFKHLFNDKLKFYESSISGFDDRNYLTYAQRIYPDEEMYLKLMNELLLQPLRDNRTGVRTHSLFAKQLKYNLLSNGGDMILPLTTTKKVSFNLIYSELLWFIRGDTDTTFLHKHNNKIWDANTSREFLDAHNLTHFKEGELGKGYGYQWRKFGGKCDQLNEVINNIRKDPYSRRHIISAWNPCDLNEVALPPCHLMFMFMCEPPTADTHDSRGFLNCHLIMRSNDMFLGHPFNVGSYALLTHMIANLVGMKAKELVITMNDCHLYETHDECVKLQSSNQMYGYPHISFNNEKRINTIDDYGIDDIKLINYYSNPPIKAKMIA